MFIAQLLNRVSSMMWAAIHNKKKQTKQNKTKQNKTKNKTNKQTK